MCNAKTFNTVKDILHQLTVNKERQYVVFIESHPRSTIKNYVERHPRVSRHWSDSLQSRASEPVVKDVLWGIGRD
jgi:hypothetical protein